MMFEEDCNFANHKRRLQRNSLYNIIKNEIDNDNYPDLEYHDYVFVFNMLKHKIEESDKIMKIERARSWLKNKKVKTWRKILFLLDGTNSNGPCGVDEIANILKRESRHIKKVLRSMEKEGLIIEVNRKWQLTDGGLSRLKYNQKGGGIPRRYYEC